MRKTDTEKKKVGIIIVLILFAVIAPVKADWDPGDDYKMHYPQLPDPNGWDVRCTAKIGQPPKNLADDWLCTETGPVTDIHIWGSWLDDQVGNITEFHVAIWNNTPIGPYPYSMPNTCLWRMTFLNGEYTERFWGEGDQGWYDPGVTNRSGDHDNISQYNFHIDPSEAFVQEEGNIYWLEVWVDVEGIDEFGWKTSLDHFEDEAVRMIPGPPGWRNLTDPSTGESLDLAFVITGEPQPSPVSALTPIGLLALLSILSVIAALTITIKRKRR